MMCPLERNWGLTEHSFFYCKAPKPWDLSTQFNIAEDYFKCFIFKDSLCNQKALVVKLQRNSNTSCQHTLLTMHYKLLLLLPGRAHPHQSTGVHETETVSFLRLKGSEQTHTQQISVNYSSAATRSKLNLINLNGRECRQWKDAVM